MRKFLNKIAGVILALFWISFDNVAVEYSLIETPSGWFLMGALCALSFVTLFLEQSASVVSVDQPKTTS